VGKRPKKVGRVVLDTNVLISALLFKGRTARIVTLWRKGKIVPVMSRETFDELRRVLEYPKFSLSQREIKAIIEEEILPFFEVVDVDRPVEKVARDPDDDKFIACAIAGKATCIVTGDKALWDLQVNESVKICHVSDFMKIFK
jgi:putative PIN family toxin of toxin-antitoxin system